MIPEEHTEEEDVEELVKERLDAFDEAQDRVTLTIPKPRVPKFVKGTASCVGSKTQKVAKDIHIQAAGLIETHEKKATARRINGKSRIMRKAQERKLAEQMANAMKDEES